MDCTGLKILFWRKMGFEITDPWETDGVVPEGEFKEVDNRKFGDSLIVARPGLEFGEHVAIYLGMGLCLHVHRERGSEVIPVSRLDGRIIAVMRKMDFA